MTTPLPAPHSGVSGTPAFWSNRPCILLLWLVEEFFKYQPKPTPTQQILGSNFISSVGVVRGQEGSEASSCDNKRAHTHKCCPQFRSFVIDLQRFYSNVYIKVVVYPLQPTLTLQNSLLTRFPETGEVSVTVQASNGRSMVQDTRTVHVYGNTVAPLWCFAAADTRSKKRQRLNKAACRNIFCLWHINIMKQNERRRHYWHRRVSFSVTPPYSFLPLDYKFGFPLTTRWCDECFASQHR